MAESSHFARRVIAFSLEKDIVAALSLEPPYLNHLPYHQPGWLNRCNLSIYLVLKIMLSLGVCLKKKLGSSE